MIEKGYKAIMSRGDDVKLDPAEVVMVEAAAEQGSLVRVKQALINPSFLITIVEDKEREMRYTSGFTHERKALGMRPLADIFTASSPQLEAGKN